MSDIGGLVNHRGIEGGVHEFKVLCKMVDIFGTR